MKRILCTILILSVSIALLMLPASAAVYQKTITKEFSIDGFIETTGDGVSTVAFGYEDYLAVVGASTAITIPSGGTGRVFAFVCYHGITGTSASSNEVKNGVISCEAVLNRNMATKSQHTAVRGGDDSATWGYYFIDPHHDENKTET